MRLQIQSTDLRLSEALEGFAREAANSTFGRLRDRVSAVVVRIADLNGPRGGHDKRCRVELALASGERVMIENTDTDAYRAIHQALARAKRTMIKRWNRNRDRRRKL